MRHLYDDDFFAYISQGSQRSASAVCDVLTPLFDGSASVLDVGCGQGVWTREFLDREGVSEAIGIDGDYVNRARLAIPEAVFVAHDLTRPLDLGRRFTLALSLEVGEHLPPDAGPTLVGTLVRHSDIVMFSAAIPGQGGESHVNERPLSYWRAEFARHGYVPVDAVRPKLVNRGEVEPWYRYNILLYVAEPRADEVARRLGAAPLAKDTEITSPAPFLWRLRCAFLRLLPVSAVTWLARRKHAWIRRRFVAGAKG